MIGRLKIWAAAFVAVALAFWFGGRKSAQTAREAEEGKAYADTRKRMDEAVVGDDPAAARRWLHERGKSDGGL